ncbi:hypothetical protein NE237_015154 [Protea cynaroides]|uniref:Uncharacterized protein n=1 Tax=Protea cynaroides TaxID=273540 RepID=A0A9Q0KDC3_9MAGN|nr:hypothetical protein NE237_015154 [Protea cynaroides]
MASNLGEEEFSPFPQRVKDLAKEGTLEECEMARKWMMGLLNSAALNGLDSTQGNHLNMVGAGLFPQEADEDLREEVIIKDDSRNKFTQKVLYDWMPEVCTHYYVFGHQIVACSIVPQLSMGVKVAQNQWRRVERRGSSKDNYPILSNREEPEQQPSFPLKMEMVTIGIMMRETIPILLPSHVDTFGRVTTVEKEGGCLLVNSFAALQDLEEVKDIAIDISVGGQSPREVAPALL